MVFNDAYNTIETNLENRLRLGIPVKFSISVVKRGRLSREPASRGKLEEN